MGDKYSELDRIVSLDISFKCEYDKGEYLASVMDKNSLHISSGFETFADAIEWIITMAKTCPLYKEQRGVIQNG